MLIAVVEAVARRLPLESFSGHLQAPEVCARPFMLRSEAHVVREGSTAAISTGEPDAEARRPCPETARETILDRHCAIRAIEGHGYGAGLPRIGVM
jgi:hypothetical protein